MTVKKERVITTTITKSEIKKYEATPFIDDLYIRELKDAKKPQLRLRYRKDRSQASWLLVYKRKWYVIGLWPVMSANDAKNQVDKKIALLLLDKQAQINGDGFKTVSQVLDLHQDKLLKTSKNRQAQVRSLIKNQLKPYIGECEVKALSRIVIMKKLFVPLLSLNAVSTLKQVHSLLNSAFKTAFTLNVIEHNVMTGLKFSMFCSGKISPKESALKKGDLKQLLIQLDQAVDVEGAMLAMIMLLQGTRIGETRKAKWREFNFQKRSWQIPIKSTKTRVSLHLPMTQVLFNLVTAYRDYQIKKYGQVSTYLFPNKKHNRCLTETEANNLIRLVSGELWQAHDLRKLFSSVNFSIGHDTTVIDLLTNHKIGVLHETYHDKEVQAVSKRDALVKYHAWLCSEDESQLMCVINARSHIAKFEHQSNENKV